MRAKILLVTKMDDTHRKPLLESQGYFVEFTSIEVVFARLAENRFHLALLSTDDGAEEALRLSDRMKAEFPSMRIALVAQRAEYVPPNDTIDAVIRQQHSPGKFLAAIQRLIDAATDGEESSTVSNGH